MEIKEMDRQKIYGATQRILHWWIATVITALIAMGWIAKVLEPGVFKVTLVRAHIVLGYALAVGIAMRLLWGFVGPEYARFSAFWHPKEWLDILRRSQRVHAAGYGHDPKASLAYATLYAAILASITTGLILAGMEHDVGPLAEVFFDDFSWHVLSLNVHESILYITTGLIVIHIGGMIDFGSSVGKSKLTPVWFEKVIGSPVTMRNWKTVLKLNEMLGQKMLSRGDL